MPEECLFFVYGTLRRGDDNDITCLDLAPRFVGAAQLHGIMYDLGGYPGVVLAGAGDSPAVVVGEVYAICPALEAKLDVIESEYPEQRDAYAKRKVDVLVAGRSQRCYVYEINPAYIAGKPVIASGDWVKDRGTQR